MYHRIKHSFTSGELSKLLFSRQDNERYKNGCYQMLNMFAKAQGPATRRPGTRFIYDVMDLGLDYDPNNPRTCVREVPFVYSVDQSYQIIFFKHTGGKVRICFATDQGLLINTWVSPTDPDYNTVYVLEITTGTFEIEKIDYVQSADTLFIVQPNRRPMELIRYGAAAYPTNDYWEFNDITFDYEPQTGGFPEWDATNGYPEHVAFFERRIVYVGNAARPRTFWFSRTDDYINFCPLTWTAPSTCASTEESSSALTFTIDSGRQSKIQWVISAKELLAGSLSDEWAIKGYGQPLAYNSISVGRHTNQGGEDLKPLMVGPAVLYLERLGRTVNQFMYDYSFEGYTNTDLTVLAPHLTDNNSIVRWDYQQTPNGVVWACRDDGLLLGLTYQREHKVVGWHRHETDGRFIDVSCNPGSNRETETWFLVERTINGVIKVYLEKMAPEFKSEDTKDGYFLDSFAVYDNPSTPVTTLSGLDHLEGKEINILADGSAHAPKTVASGQISLDRSCTHVIVGLPFDSLVEPAPPEHVSSNSGATLGRIQRVVKIYAQLYNSVGMEIGRRDDETGDISYEEVPFRRPGDASMTPVPLFTGTKSVDFPEGYSRDATVIIRQRQPLPLTVQSVVDIVMVGT